MLLLKARKASPCSGGYRGGPPLFLDQTEALTSEKKFLEPAPPPPPPSSPDLDDHTLSPHLSEGMDPPLAWIGHLV